MVVDVEIDEELVDDKIDDDIDDDIDDEIDEEIEESVEEVAEALAFVPDLVTRRALEVAEDEPSKLEGVTVGNEEVDEGEIEELISGRDVRAEVEAEEVAEGIDVWLLVKLGVSAVRELYAGIAAKGSLVTEETGPIVSPTESEEVRGSSSTILTTVANTFVISSGLSSDWLF